MEQKEIWILFSILLVISNHMAQSTGWHKHDNESLCYSFPYTEEEQLCVSMGIEKPIFFVRWLKTTETKAFKNCANTMNSLLKWMEYEELLKMIRIYGQPKSVTEIENVKSTFDSYSWKNPYCIRRLSEILYEMKKHSIVHLKSILTFKNEDWWKPILTNENIRLNNILETLVKDETFLKTFEIYLSWMSKNASFKCNELSLVEVSAFGTMKKFDARQFESLFNILRFTSNYRNYEGLWNSSRLKSLFKNNHMKDSDFDYVVFVLQKSDLPIGLPDHDINGWNFKNLMDTLWNIRQLKKLPIETAIYFSAIEIRLNKDVFDGIMESGTNKYGVTFPVFLFLYFKTFREINWFKIEKEIQEGFVVLLWKVADLEYKATKMESNYLILYSFIRVCQSNSLTISFMNTFLDNAAVANLPVKTFEPFICIVCHNNMCRDSQDRKKVLSLMNVYIQLQLMNIDFLTNMKSVTYQNDKYVNLYNAVEIYNRLGQSVVRVGLPAYYQNVIAKKATVVCPKELIEALIEHVGTYWSTSEYQEMFNIVCPAMYQAEITEDINKLGKNQRGFKDVKKAVKDRLAFEKRVCGANGGF